MNFNIYKDSYLADWGLGIGDWRSEIGTSDVRTQVTHSDDVF